MVKSSQAFRTIREVAEWLDVAAHVLRFWESKFPQIKPVKRAGGRRYYRPSDMEFVGGIKVLLHDRGLTIRGVQRMIRENGVASVAALSPPLDLTEAVDADLSDNIFTDADQDAVQTAPDASQAPAPPPSAAPKTAPPLPPEPVADVATESSAGSTAPDRLEQPSLALDLPLHPAPAAQAKPKEDMAAAPDILAQLAQLAALAAAPARLRSAGYVRRRPALVALRDKMQANPPA